MRISLTFEFLLLFLEFQISILFGYTRDVHPEKTREYIEEMSLDWQIEKRPLERDDDMEEDELGEE